MSLPKARAAYLSSRKWMLEASRWKKSAHLTSISHCTLLDPKAHYGVQFICTRKLQRYVVGTISKFTVVISVSVVEEEVVMVP